MSLFITALCFITVAFESGLACPNATEIPDCKCSASTHKRLRVFCSNITDMYAFQSQMTKFRNQNISVLSLRNLTLPYLPYGIFKGISIQSIQMSYGQLHSLGHPSNIGSPFDGLEENLTSFLVYRVEKIGVLDFSVFAKLKNLSHIDFEFTNVTKFEGWSSIRGMSKLRLFTIADTTLRTLETKALANCKDLMMVLMIQNKIESLNRDFFPNPAPKLKDLMFGGNEIVFVSENLFENMPVLQYVDLSDNQLTTVSEYLFRPVWNVLKGLQIRGNPLHCDRSLFWFTDAVQTQKNEFRFDDLRFCKCATPPRLAKRTIVSLSTSELDSETGINSLN